MASLVRVRCGLFAVLIAFPLGAWGAGSGVAAASTGAMTPSPQGLSDSSIPALPHPRCAAGQTPILAYAAGKTGDGGFIYDFKIAGRSNEARVPHANFRPTTASAEQLAEYGFPPRPQSADGQAKWTSDFSDFKRVAIPEFCLTDRMNMPADVQPGSAAPDGSPVASVGYASTAQSGNWGGIVTYSGSGWVAVQGDWYQSQAANCYCGTSDTDESTWTGIGGFADLGLLQEGTDMQGTPSNIFPWFEYLHACNTAGCNPPEIAITGLTVTAGMHIHTYTAYQTSNGQTNFLVCAGGSCQSLVGTFDSSYYDGRYADYIDERPTYSSSAGSYYKPITNFEYNDWFNGQAEDHSGSWYGLDPTPGWGVTMENSANQRLVGPTAFGAYDTYTDSWFQAQ